MSGVLKLERPLDLQEKAKVNVKLTDLEGNAVPRGESGIMWVRGDSDMIVSDNSFFDFGTLGSFSIDAWIKTTNGSCAPRRP